MRKKGLKVLNSPQPNDILFYINFFDWYEIEAAWDFLSFCRNPPLFCKIYFDLNWLNFFNVEGSMTVFIHNSNSYHNISVTRQLQLSSKCNIFESLKIKELHILHSLFYWVFSLDYRDLPFVLFAVLWHKWEISSSDNSSEPYPF